MQGHFTDFKERMCIQVHKGLEAESCQKSASLSLQRCPALVDLCFAACLSLSPSPPLQTAPWVVQMCGAG